LKLLEEQKRLEGIFDKCLLSEDGALNCINRIKETFPTICALGICRGQVVSAIVEQGDHLVERPIEPIPVAPEIRSSGIPVAPPMSPSKSIPNAPPISFVPVAPPLLTGEPIKKGPELPKRDQALLGEILKGKQLKKTETEKPKELESPLLSGIRKGVQLKKAQERKQDEKEQEKLQKEKERIERLWRSREEEKEEEEKQEETPQQKQLRLLREKQSYDVGNILASKFKGLRSKIQEDDDEDDQWMTQFIHMRSRP
jgi:hypothetical protein